MDTKAFDPKPIVLELENNIGVFQNLFRNTEAVLRFKPDPAKWNLLEVACHLLDEEREDFRARLKHVLNRNPGPMPPIDPPLWVIERNYAGQDLSVVLKEFTEERNQSVAWLKSLGNVNWDLFYTHPKLGKMTARLFLSNWLAHDYLHMRQILGLKFGFLQMQTGEDLSYAGTW